ncbi:MAG: DUF4232 domain-containing protein [Candidatus Dormibacteria bacterium]
MSDEHLEDALRARLHETIDPRVPGAPAEQRILAAVTGAGRVPAGRFGFRLGPRLGAVIAAAMAVVVVGGALGISLALRNGNVNGHPAPAATVPPGVLPSPSPTTTPFVSSPPSPSSSLAGVQPCAGDALTARLYDQDGAAGTLGGDIALRNTGKVDCTLKGYVNLQGVISGRLVQLGVTHSAGGPLLNNNNGTLPTVRMVTLHPGQSAYVAFEDSDVPNGPTPCSSTQTLLITPPQGGRAVSLTGTPVSLCGGFRAKLWIDIAPVSSTPYYNTKIA